MKLDIDALCMAGIPIVTEQGHNGGISIMENYKIDKTLLSTSDLQAVLAGLRSLDSVSGTSRYAQLMEKLSAGASNMLSGDTHILIDLSSRYKESLTPKIELIHSAIHAARTNNASPDMGAVIGGLWNRFYREGIYASIPGKKSEKALGIYTDYEDDEKSDYTVLVAHETSRVPQAGEYTVCKIPAGRYAKFVVRGDMVQAVAAAWQEIWKMDLPRTFQCDFEEYQNDSMEHAEIHIYIGLKNLPV